MQTPSRVELTRLGGVILGSTLVLTTTFIGIIGLLSGGSPDAGTRLPVYVLAMALGFVGVVVVSEQQYGARADGRSVIASASIMALLVFLVVTLSGEGVIFAIQNPEEVVLTELFLYVVAAGLIGTGLGYWGLNHWREFAEGRLLDGRGGL